MRLFLPLSCQGEGAGGEVLHEYSNLSEVEYISALFEYLTLIFWR